MEGLHYIRRVRRSLIVQDTPPVPATAQTTDHGPQTTGPAEAVPVEIKLVNEVSGGTPETTRETRVLPEETSHEETTAIEESGPAVGE